MPALEPMPHAEEIRALFISDTHLGCKHCRLEPLVDLLENCQPDHIYLVGDFFDGWRLRRRWRWSTIYTRLLRRLLQLESLGARLYYTPGNHDEFLRDFLGDFGVVRVADEFIHVTADQRRLLVLHGDRFDDIERRSPWLSLVGSLGYDWLIALNRGLNRARGWLGLAPWSLSRAIKHQVKSAVCFVSDFEGRLARHARERRCEGVVCGHVHTPTAVVTHGVLYCNTGDWVENASLLVELQDGQLALAHAAPTRHDEAWRWRLEPAPTLDNNLPEVGPRLPRPLGGAAIRAAPAAAPAQRAEANAASV